MDIETMIGEIKNSARRKFVDKREFASVKTEIVEVLAERKTISGENDMIDSVMKIAWAMQSDPDFNAALDVVASKMLNLFPVKVATDEDVTPEE